MLPFNVVQLVLSIVAVVVLFTLPLLGIAPNRILSAQGQYFYALIEHTAAMGVFIGSLSILILAFGKSNPLKQLTTIVMCGALTTLLTWFCGEYAAQTSLENERVRISFASGYWTLGLLWWLIAMDSAQKLISQTWLRAIAGSVFFIPCAYLLLSGHLATLSLLKEYQANASAFDRALIEHLRIVGLTLIVTVILGFWFGVLCYRHQRFSRVCLSILGLLQTIPSIALFGLLIAPLSLLSQNWPWLKTLGLSGIGTAPAVIALILYSLLPMVRSTLAGLNQVPEALLTAATGMGMSARQRLWRIHVCLALPVILSGLRVTTVQAIGLTMVAALIGAGGFGAIMFRGLAASALDLILLGVLPVVALAALADAIFKILVAWTLPPAQLNGAQHD
ncbi:ABC transporter permease [Vibrio sp. AK197]